MTVGWDFLTYNFFWDTESFYQIQSDALVQLHLPMSKQHLVIQTVLGTLCRYIHLETKLMCPDTTHWFFFYLAMKSEAFIASLPNFDQPFRTQMRPNMPKMRSAFFTVLSIFLRLLFLIKKALQHDLCLQVRRVMLKGISQCFPLLAGFIVSVD